MVPGRIDTPHGRVAAPLLLILALPHGGVVGCSDDDGSTRDEDAVSAAADTGAGGGAEGDGASADAVSDRGAGDSWPTGDTAQPADVSAPTPPASFTGTLKGVVSSAGKPVAGALVQLGGRLQRATTGADGSFALVAQQAVNLGEIALTAGKTGYYSAGIEVAEPGKTLAIELIPVTHDDNPEYTWVGAVDTDAAPHCLHCHSNMTAPWSSSAHRNSAANPKLHDMYNGTASGAADKASCAAIGGAWRKGVGADGKVAANKCYVPGGGVLSDLNAGACGGAGQPTCDDPSAAAANQPQTVGACGSCHAPRSTGADGRVNINKVPVLDRADGVDCDFCHKVEKVNSFDKPGMQGSLHLRRPAQPVFGDSEPIYFGPLPDVISANMGNSYAPQFGTSTFCGGCHQWVSPPMKPGDAGELDTKKWPTGLPIQDTLHEWQNSAFAKQGTQCQHCHMPAIKADTAAIPLTGATIFSNGSSGWPRPFGQVRHHGFTTRPPATTDAVGPGEPPRQSLREPLKLKVETVKAAGTLRVDVDVTNHGAGHSIPTGTPSRQLVLLVRATSNGESLHHVGGHSVPSWGGAVVSGTLEKGGSTLSGKKLALPSGELWPAAAKGLVVRFLGAGESWADYPATRWFGAKERTAKDKGMALPKPLGSAVIMAVEGQVATLASAVTATAGSRFFATAATLPALKKVDDKAESIAIAGRPGWLFTKVMRSAAKQAPVPFFRAVDIAADNRIPAGATAKVSCTFAWDGAADVQVEALLIYRKYPWPRAHQRGWQVHDVVRASALKKVSP